MKTKKKGLITHPEKGCSGLIYVDGQYSECHYCKERCERAFRCVGCGTVKGAFYSRHWDFFFCNTCYQTAEQERDIYKGGW